LLANRLRETLADLKVRVSRPSRMTELRIVGLDDSITQADVALAIGKIGDASWLDVKISNIRRTGRGMGAMWARCPLEAAIKVAERGRITVG